MDYKNNEQKEENGSFENLIFGRNSCLEAVRSGREIDKLFVAHGVTGGTITAIIAKCKEKGILHNEAVFVGDDYGLGGNDEAVYKSDFHFITIDNYKDFPEKAAILLNCR